MFRYALCYPSLSEADEEFIRAFRQKHDARYRDVVAHHFTIGFGIESLGAVEYVEHVKRQAQGQDPIRFVCRYAMVGRDDINFEEFYVFLVPDEGFSEISKLHDRLYTGPFEPFHRVDIPFIPHIGIATNPDAAAIKTLCDELNDRGLHIEGRIDSITVAQYDGRVITDLERIGFRGSGA